MKRTLVLLLSLLVISTFAGVASASVYWVKLDYGGSRYSWYPHNGPANAGNPWNNVLDGPMKVYKGKLYFLFGKTYDNQCQGSYCGSYFGTTGVYEFNGASWGNTRGDGSTIGFGDKALTNNGGYVDWNVGNFGIYNDKLYVWNPDTIGPMWHRAILSKYDLNDKTTSTQAFDFGDHTTILSTSVYNNALYVAVGIQIYTNANSGVRVVDSKIYRCTENGNALACTDTGIVTNGVVTGMLTYNNALYFSSYPYGGPYPYIYTDHFTLYKYDSLSTTPIMSDTQVNYFETHNGKLYALSGNSLISYDGNTKSTLNWFNPSSIGINSPSKMISYAGKLFMTARDGSNNPILVKCDTGNQVCSIQLSDIPEAGGNAGQGAAKWPRSVVAYNNKIYIANGLSEVYEWCDGNVYNCANNPPTPLNPMLTVTKFGSGSVTSSPNGINCGIDCTENYSAGTSVTLTATPTAGNTFIGWSGNCSGSSSTCTLAMNNDKSVSATFSSGLICLANPNNQTIITIYSQQNSHAAVFNSTFSDPLATIKINYNTIFGHYYIGPDCNPWSCSGTNGVVKLNALNNSHAEGFSNNNYNVLSCYGDLSCSVLNVNNCPAGSSLVLSMSDVTNAHVASDGSYPYKLCCSSGTPIVIPGTIQSAEWQNTLGMQISQAILTQQVKAVANTQNLDGKVVNFTIYNSSNGFELYRESSSASNNKAEITKTVQNIVQNNAGIGAMIYFSAVYYNSTTGVVISSVKSNNLTIVASVINGCSVDKNFFSINGVATSVFLNNDLCLVGEPDINRTDDSVTNDCCPTGYVCNINSTSQNKFACIDQCAREWKKGSRWGVISLCDDYNYILGDLSYKESQCRADCNDAAQSDTQKDAVMNASNGRAILSTLLCGWNTLAKKCKPNWNNKGDDGTVDPANRCTQTVLDDSGTCENGESARLIRYMVNLSQRIGTGIPAQYQIIADPAKVCERINNVEIPCRRSVVELPIFGILQVIVAVIIIFIIYLIVKKKK